MIDILFIQETKLDDSFPMSQFHVPQYVMYRLDVRQDCGGIMAHVRSDVPQRRRPDLEDIKSNTGRVECLVLEITIKNEKWLLGHRLILESGRIGVPSPW